MGIITTSSDIKYPTSDGQPMAENTLQFEWIVALQGNLDAMYADDPNVFVAGDLLWYPIEGNNRLRAAPDAMVVFGRPKGHRGSYMQWLESDIAPQVVFEVLSPGNRAGEMTRKFQFYERYGVDEYYLLDPDHITLDGWLRRDGALGPIEETHRWVSPKLSIRFEVDDENVKIYKPDGTAFLTYLELFEENKKHQQQATTEASRADAEAARADRLAARLRELGESPE